MLCFYALDIALQETIARFSIEHFLQELAEQLDPPDRWQMTAADLAIAAYQRGHFEYALKCISAGEKPVDKRPVLPHFTTEPGELSLRTLWRRLVQPSSVFAAASGVGHTAIGTTTYAHSK